MDRNRTPEILRDIIAASEKFPDRPALSAGGNIVSYSELMRSVSGIRKLLSRYDCDIVGIFAADDVNTYASVLAVLLSGRTYVILHPDYPSERNRRILEHSGAGVLLHSGIRNLAFVRQVGIPKVCTALADGFSSSESMGTPDEYSRKQAYIIYTSGSTGEPKGVSVSRDNLDAFYIAYRKLGFNMDEHDRVLQMFRLTFDVSVVSFLYPLTLGACVCTVPEGAMKYLGVFDVLESEKITFAAVPPSAIRLMRPYFDEISLPYLKYLIVTAEATEVGLLRDFRHCIPEAEIYNLYGPTEATIYCTAYKVPETGIKEHNGILSIGRPFDGMEAFIVGPDDDLLPDGQKGEMIVSGPQVMSGYWRDGLRSSGVFMKMPDGKVGYRTGDICFRDADGDLMYCGRKDSQVKIRGFRIELGEIEHCAKSFYGGGLNVVVLPLADDTGNMVLHLAVESSDMEEVPLKKHLEANLPGYMIPGVFHGFGVFPLNANGKVDRNAIRELIRNK